MMVWSVLVMHSSVRIVCALFGTAIKTKIKKKQVRKGQCDTDKGVAMNSGRLGDVLSSPDVFGEGDGAVRLDLPPGFDLVTLREGGDAFVHAQKIAAQRGAGTLVWVQRFDLVEFAVVLEPDEPLKTARRAFYAGMCAMADSLAVYCPPEKPIHFHWPDAMLFDHGLIGGGKLAWPLDAKEDQSPEWLVFGGMIRTTVIRNNNAYAENTVSLEPGTWSVGTALETEGFEDVNAGAIVESFCRHLMVHVDSWTEQGFKRVGKEWLARLSEHPADDDATSPKHGIDSNGDLLIHAVGENTLAPRVKRKNIIEALALQGWYDADMREPKL
jgi:biotin-(acetyl-CoA carboxylase) ligase